MLLYEINAALAELLGRVDEETGELLCSPEEIDGLMLERQEALEGLALTVKNLSAEAAAIRNEEMILRERRSRLEDRAEKIKGFLQNMLAGDGLKTPRVAVSYRRSKAVEIDPERFFMPENEDWFRYRDPEPDKTAIAAALKAGKTIPGAEMTEKVNMTIK